MAEQLLWERLRRRALLGLRFRRQHPIGSYITDFFCDEAGLVIEVDGEIHLQPEQKSKDRLKDIALKDFGLTVLRFSNVEIETDIDQVINKIAQTAKRSL